MTRRAAIVAGIAAGVAACVPSGRALRAPVDTELARRLAFAPEAAADDAAAARVVDDLLGRPLDADAAVRIALANSPRVRAAFAEIGVAAGGLAVALGLLDVDGALRFGGGHVETELTVVQNLMGFFTAARQRAAGRADVASARARAAATSPRRAARVEVAFHNLLAAQQEVELRRTAFDAADAAAALRERMHAAGNTPALALARDRDARGQARLDAGRAEAAVEIARERLNGLLGLSGDRTKWTAAGRLARPPAAAPALDDLETAAIAASLDVVAANAGVEAAANRAAEARLRAVVPHLGVGVAFEKLPGDTTVGPALRLGLPLLDWSAGARARTRAEQSRASHELTAVAVELRAQARAARVAALAAHQQARHIEDVILPLRQQIVDETLKHYNAMDADPFSLILARRELVDAGNQYLDALRRYANAMTAATALRRGAGIDELDAGAAPTSRTTPTTTRTGGHVEP
ncbi:MAG: TolC family protein [Deltaproteobacteria bacterium]|nr:TolC family protein [Deltaproteobacteria bacterium]